MPPRATFLLLAALMAGASLVSARELTAALPSNTFPPYNCVNNLAVSPYVLSAPVQKNAQTICWTVLTKAPTLASPCNVMDFYKLELEVVPACKDGIRRFFVNGVERVEPTPQAFGNGRMLIKMPEVGLNLSNANGSSFCIQAASATSCNTPATLCAGGACTYAIIKSGVCDCCPVGPPPTPPPPPPSPPPPSPPPPSPPPPSPPPPSPPPPANFTPTEFFPPAPPPYSPFPYCKCNRTSGITPFSLSPIPVMTSNAQGPIYTFTVLSSTPIDPSNTCANTTLYKTEFWSTLGCKGSVRGAFVNGQPKAASWDSTYGVYKITNIGFPTPATPGVVGTIGLQLYPKAPCPTLAAICAGHSAYNGQGVCTYSTFDDSKTCCPLGQLNVAGI